MSSHSSGIYNRLVAAVPAAEINEVTSVMGVALVDSIYSKWTELNILIEIINESINDSNNKHNNVVYNKLTVFDSIYNNEINAFIVSNKKFLNIASISTIKSDVIRLLKRENDALERDIASLNALIEQEMDSHDNHFDSGHAASSSSSSSVSSKSRDKDQCSSCSVRVKGTDSNKKLFCADCRLRTERRERKLADKLPKKGQPSLHASAAELDSGPLPSASSARGLGAVEGAAAGRVERESKTKSRLQRAKDELHFLDF